MSNESAENEFRIKPEPESDREGNGMNEPQPSAIDDLRELPAGYREMFLIARDPHWLFTYWDLDYSKFPASRKLFLEVFRENQLESAIEINEIARNWYLPVAQANSSYHVVFGYKDEFGAWTEVAKSQPTRTPPESISAKWDAEFATVPFHLSFNFLLDVINAARTTGEPLAEALARLQQAAVGSHPGSSSWGAEQLRVLEVLLGKDLLERLSRIGSGGVAEFFQKEFAGKLDSESASELLARGRLAELLAPAESSLFSGALRQLAAGELASAGVSSFGVARLGGESSAALAAGSELRLGASEQVGGGSEQFLGASEQVSGASEQLLGPSEQVSGASEQLLGASEQLLGASEQLLGASERMLGVSEQLLGASEQFLGASERMLGASEQFLGLGASEQWVGASEQLLGASELWAGASAQLFGASELWAGASAQIAGESLASWQAAFGAIPTSWETGISSAAVSSWSGVEFGPSSWSQLVTESSLFSAFGASWSAQPFSIPQREFFMHVNAEVIFYGGTHPQAKVTIDGRPVQLQPDGTFRYHFRFPDADFEIPIVAVSPDGVETRSATLRFTRGTARRGEVGATAQPDHLVEPMGRR
jgi:hypothetical protein